MEAKSRGCLGASLSRECHGTKGSQHKVDGRQRSEQSRREYAVTHSASSLETAEPLSFEHGCPTLDWNLDFQIMNLPLVFRRPPHQCAQLRTCLQKTHPYISEDFTAILCYTTIHFTLNYPVLYSKGSNKVLELQISWPLDNTQKDI